MELITKLQMMVAQYENHELKSSMGLCHHFRYVLNIPESQIHSLMMEACNGWEHFSGNVKFPINHPDFIGDDYDDDHGYMTTLMGHYFDGEYGRRRMELVHRMINILKGI